MEEPSVDNKLVAAVGTAIALSLAVEASAGVTRFVDAQFTRPDGTKSVPMRREVEFLTGAELAKRSKEREYSAFAVYALFAYDKTSITFVIELQDVLVTTLAPFGDADFERVFSRSAVEGVPVNADATTWYLQAKDPTGRWIDQRAPTGN